MEKKIKTVIDVQCVPADKFIPMIDPWEGTCPFCGKKLEYRIVGFGRDKCQEYYPCSCEVAQAAREHNNRQEEYAREEYLRKQEKEKQHQEETQKSITITAAQMLCVISGCILPAVEPIEADDAVGEAMRHLGFTEGSSKEKLEAYAEKEGFADNLKKAAEVLVEFVTSSAANWETDISEKVSQLCDEFGIPELIKL